MCKQREKVTKQDNINDMRGNTYGGKKRRTTVKRDNFKNIQKKTVGWGNKWIYII